MGGSLILRFLTGPISTILTPILREDVECFGEDTCYSLAFGIPAILMAIATVSSDQN